MRLFTKQDMGADVNAQNSDGLTVLHQAIIKGNHAVVEFLLKNGSNVHLKTRCGETPLVTAIRKNDLTILNLLMKCGAHVTCVDATTLAELASYAAKMDSTKKLEALCLAGANLNAADEIKQTPLHKAVLCKSFNAAEYLTKHNVPMTKDILGFTPLDYAKQLKRENFVQLLSPIKQ